MSAEYVTSLSQFQFGDMLIEYLLATESQTVGLRMIPSSMVDQVATRREFLQSHETLLLPESFPPMRAWQVEPLVQVKLTGDAVSGGFSQGISGCGFAKGF